MMSNEVELDGDFDGKTRQPQVIGSGQRSGSPAQRIGTANSDGLRMRNVARQDEDDDEYEESLGVRQESFTDTERTWSLATAIACGMDLVASSTIMIVAFKYAYRDNGVSLYSMGFQALSHLLGSTLLLARLGQELLFYRSAQAHRLIALRDHRRRSLHREQMFSVMMGCGMLISSVALLFKAFRKLRFWDVWHLDHVGMDQEVATMTDWLAWWGFGIYSLQAMFRFVAGRQLRQALVWHCFIASMVSLTYLLVLAIAALEEKEWSWKAEPIAAIALVFVTLCEGIRIVYYYFDDMDTRLQYEPRA